MRVLFLQAADFYRSLVLRLNHSDATQVKVGPQVEQAVSNALAHWRTGVEGAIRCWNRCLQAVEQVDRNANQAALLEAWTADLMSFGGT